MVTVIDVSVPRVSERKYRCGLLVFVPGSGVCHQQDASSTTSNTVMAIGTSTWSARERPGSRMLSNLRSCGLHVWELHGFPGQSSVKNSVSSRSVTEIVGCDHEVATS